MRRTALQRLFTSTATAQRRELIMISLDWTRPKDPPMSLGHASILANLKHKNLSVVEKSFAVNKPEFSTKEVVDFILHNASQKRDCDLALGAFVWNEPAIQTILPELRRAGFTGRIILGGPQISYVKNGVENYYPHGDVFIRGYAEEALAQLVMSHEEKPTIPGVHYAKEPDLGISAKINFEDSPSPLLSGQIKPQRFIRWEAQRGCPFRCSFCQHRESDSSQQRRHFQKSRIMQEIEWICAHPVIQDIAVLDPTFNSGPNYLSILEEFYKQKYQGKLSFQARMEMVIPEFLGSIERLNQAGEAVLEFGLQTIHPSEQDVIQRPNNLRKIIKVLSDTKKRKIPTEISLIFGLPGQTVESFQASIDFCKEHGAGKIYAFPLMLLRGTPLHDRKNELGLIESSDFHLDEIPRIQRGIPQVVASRSFSFDEWQQMAQMAAELEEYNLQTSTNLPSFRK